MAIFKQNLSQFPNAKAACLLVHGLNNKPEVLFDIANFLESLSLPSVIIGLTGHNNDITNLESITKKIWHQDVLDGYKLIKKKCDDVYFIGFSLGASIGLDMISESIHYKKMILLAPAIAPRIPVKFLDYISPVLPSLPLYSMAPKSYIANKYLPLKCYKVLLSIYKSVHKKKFASANIPTLVFADPKDETMSLGDIKKLIENYQLSNWKLILLDSNNVVSKVSFHHLIVDREAMGFENWEVFKKEVSAFLG